MPIDSPEIKQVDGKKEREIEAIEIYKLGLEYSNSGQVDKAIQEYRKALEIDPNLAEAHLNLGWSYAIKKQNYEIALQETLEAIRLKPDMLTAHRNLWWIYRLQKMPEKALETLKNIIKLEPDEAVNYLNLGDTYVSDMKAFDLAIESYQRGLGIDPKNHYIHQKLGKAYEFRKKYDLAITEYKKTLELLPTDTYTYLFMAVALGKAGRQKEIAPLMKEAHETISKTMPLLDRWDLKLLKFFEGELSEEEILRKGELNNIHKCQALYYAGLKNIWEGKKAKGMDFLARCLDLKIDSLAEYEYAKTELELNRQK
ncbi:tetratricopeptide repeat protein [bacterium]|nr:tetratricopeptide repeat protein [bacterium]